MTRPTRVEVNCITGEVLEIELTDAEILALETAQVQAEVDRVAREAADAAVAAAKKAAHSKLAALGLTAEEIAALSK